jgi:iron complex outermembrane recepter protein
MSVPSRSHSIPVAQFVAAALALAATDMYLSAVALADTATPETSSATQAQSTNTQAQGADAIGNVQMLQEVVVKAQHRNENLQNVPLAVTAVAPQEMQELNLTDLTSLQEVTPDLNSTTGINYQFTYIRGVGSAFQEPGVEPAVATYIDGAYLERGYGINLDILDPESVEVLRGPQGTLWGRNATGGVILINTADPTFQNSGYLHAEIGSLGHQLVDGVLNTPINDALAARVAVRYDNDDGYVTNLPDGYQFGGRASWTARAKLLFKPNSEFSSVLEYQFDNVTFSQDPNAEFLPAVYCAMCGLSAYTLPVTNPYTTVIDVLNRGNGGSNHSQFFDLRTKYDLPVISFTNTAAYRRMTSFGLFDGDYTELSGFNIAQWSGASTFTDDLLAETNLSGPLNAMAGLDFLHDNSWFAEDYYSTPQWPATPSVFNTVSTKSFSGFAEFTLKPLPSLLSGLKLTGGERWTEDRRNIFTDHITFTKATPRIVLAYDTRNLNLYASYNEGFKSGGYSVPSTTPNVFLPETNKSYEVGAKYRSDSGRLTANLSVFRYLYTNIQTNTVNQTNPNAISLIQNANGEGSGAELETTWIPVDSLKIFDGLSYLDAHYTFYPNADVQVPVYNSSGMPVGMTTGTENLGGTPFPQAAKWSGFLGSTVSGRVWNGWQGELTGFLRYSSWYYFDAGGGGPLQADREPGFTTVKLSGKVMPEQGNYYIGFYVDNLTGRKYYNFRFTTAPFGGMQIIARPRTFGLRVGYDF